MKIESTMTDEAVLRELGERLERARLATNLTQAALAERAGVSKRTVERFESGEVGTQLTGFLRLCRAMQVLNNLDLILPDDKPSPMELIRHQGKRRQRATTSREPDQPQKPWTWGDEP